VGGGGGGGGSQLRRKLEEERSKGITLSLALFAPKNALNLSASRVPAEEEDYNLKIALKLQLTLMCGVLDTSVVQDVQAHPECRRRQYHAWQQMR